MSYLNYLKEKVSKMNFKKDEMFQFFRWTNFSLGLLSIYYCTLGAGLHYLSLGFINMSIWAFTRKVKKDNV